MELIANLNWSNVALGALVWLALVYLSAQGVQYLRTHYTEYDDYGGGFVYRYEPCPFTLRDAWWIPFGPLALALFILANALSEH